MDQKRKYVMGGETVSPYGDAAGRFGNRGDLLCDVFSLYTHISHTYTCTHTNIYTHTTNVIYTLYIINIYSLLLVEDLFSPKVGFERQLHFF